MLAPGKCASILIAVSCTFAIVAGSLCPSGQEGTGCRVIRLESNREATDLNEDSLLGDYQIVDGVSCTGRPMYRLLANHSDGVKVRYLVYVHLLFWPALSAWMVMENDPRGTSACDGTGISSIDRLGLMYLHSENASPAHYTSDKFWFIKTKDVFNLYNKDTRVNARCISGCTDCPAGRASRGCNTIELKVDDDHFTGNDADRIRGIYLRKSNIVGEHAVYARVSHDAQSTPANTSGKENMASIEQGGIEDSMQFDAWISYTRFQTFRNPTTMEVVFKDGYCLQYEAPLSSTVDLNLCAYVAKATPITDPSSPADERLNWTEAYPMFNPATGISFECEACTNCPSSYYSSPGSVGCSFCQPGRFSENPGSPNCSKCPNGFYLERPTSTSCTICEPGKYSDKEHDENSGCKMCQKGRFSTKNFVSCQLCPIGYFQDREGSTECRKCETGSKSKMGSSSCDLCPPHTFVKELTVDEASKFDLISPNSTLSSSVGKIMQTCIQCPKCTVRTDGPFPCGECSPQFGFELRDGFWSPSFYEVGDDGISDIELILALSTGDNVLPCDIIGFDYVETSKPSGKAEGIVLEKSVIRLTACKADKGSNSSFVTCEKGYSGFMCAECAPGFGHGGRKSTCRACDASIWSWVRMLVITCAGILLVSYLVKRKSRKQSASLERVGLMYLQVSGYALSLAVNWPHHVHVFLQFESSMGNANSFSFADVECLFRNSMLFDSWYYTYCLILLVLPFFLASLLVIGYTILHYCFYSSKNRNKDIDDDDDLSDLSRHTEDPEFRRAVRATYPLRSQLVNICVITMYLTWSWCTLCVLQVMFDCTDKGDGILRLSLDVSEICYRPNTNHRTFLTFVAVPAFLFYVVGAPLAVGTILFLIRNRLGDTIVLNQYGFLLAGYRQERFFWEMVVMARRFCIVLAVVSLDSFLELQLAVCSLVCLFFLILHIVYAPYATDEATLLSRLNVAMSAHLASVTVKHNVPHDYESKDRKRSVTAASRRSIETISRHLRGHSSGILSVHPRNESAQGHSSRSRSIALSSQLVRSQNQERREESIPKVTAQSVAAYGKRVSLVERNALITNYVTFYMALFITGNAGFAQVWTDMVGVILIAANITFMLYFVVKYRNTMFQKIRKEKHNAKRVIKNLSKRVRNMLEFLKRDTPPVHSADSIRIDAQVSSVIASLASHKRSQPSLKSFTDIELTSLTTARALPQGWEEYFDSASGYFFWVGPNGRATWDPPDGMEGVNPNLAREALEDEESTFIHTNPI